MFIIESGQHSAQNGFILLFFWPSWTKTARTVTSVKHQVIERQRALEKPYHISHRRYVHLDCANLIVNRYYDGSSSLLRYGKSYLICSFFLSRLLIGLASFSNHKHKSIERKQSLSFLTYIWIYPYKLNQHKFHWLLLC